MIWKSTSKSIEKKQFKPKENILLADKIYFKVKFSIGDKKRPLLIDKRNNSPGRFNTSELVYPTTLSRGND